MWRSTGFMNKHFILTLKNMYLLYRIDIFKSCTDDCSSRAGRQRTLCAVHAVNTDIH